MRVDVASEAEKKGGLRELQELEAERGFEEVYVGEDTARCSHALLLSRPVTWISGQKQYYSFISWVPFPTVISSSLPINRRGSGDDTDCFLDGGRFVLPR
jgi:hypothetical protein